MSSTKTAAYKPPDFASETGKSHDYLQNEMENVHRISVLVVLLKDQAIAFFFYHIVWVEKKCQCMSQITLCS